MLTNLYFSTIYRFFAVATCSADGKFLGIFPKWYEYLQVNDVGGQCKVTIGSGDSTLTNILPGLVPIGLAVVDMLMRLIAIVAVGYVIYGAFRYITSQGEPENTKAALQTIINALIGLVIAIISAAVVAFVGAKLGG